MAYELDALTDNCYEGTTCLINKFDIRDSEQLALMESAITFAKAAELERTPIDGWPVSFRKVGRSWVDITPSKRHYWVYFTLF